jgi:hypothetical protein
MAALLFACAELGFHFGKRKKERSHENEEKQAGTIMGATLGLLAFMLAFTRPPCWPSTSASRSASCCSSAWPFRCLP